MIFSGWKNANTWADTPSGQTDHRSTLVHWAPVLSLSSIQGHVTGKQDDPVQGGLPTFGRHLHHCLKFINRVERRRLFSKDFITQQEHVPQLCLRQDCVPKDAWQGQRRIWIASHLLSPQGSEKTGCKAHLTSRVFRCSKLPGPAWIGQVGTGAGS